MSATNKKLLGRLLKFCYLIIAAAVLMGCIGYLFSNATTENKYKSEMLLYVQPYYNDRGEDQTDTFINNITGIATSSAVLNTLMESPKIAEYNLKMEDLQKLINVVKSNGSTLTVTCVAESPQKCKDILEVYGSSIVDTGNLLNAVNLPANVDTKITIYTKPLLGTLDYRQSSTILILACAVLGAIIAAVLIELPVWLHRVNYEVTELTELFDCPVLSVIEPEGKRNEK